MSVLSEVMESYTEFNTRGQSARNPAFTGNIPFSGFDLFAIETVLFFSFFHFRAFFISK